MTQTILKSLDQSRKFRTVLDTELNWSPNGNPVVTLNYTDATSETREITPKMLLGDGDGNTKLRKNRKRGFMTRGVSLSPHTSAGIGNLCPHATKGCIAGCLDGTGLGGVFESIHISRMMKTVCWFNARDWFKASLVSELDKVRRKAYRADLDLCVRLNVFSDIPWEKQFSELSTRFSDVWFYDYTKNPNRAGLVCPNYWLTFSRSENNESHALRLLAEANNVAVVFAGELPKTWNGYKVIDGDESDLRFLDSRGTIHGRVVGLKLKYATLEQREASIQSGFAV